MHSVKFGVTSVFALAGLAAGAAASGPPNVAIVAAAATVNTDCRFVFVQQMLQNSGLFGAVDIINANTSTPTLQQLAAYDAVLTWSNFVYQDRAAFGNVLADYVDGGGGVVVAMFAQAGATITIGGRWVPDYEVVIGGSGQTQGTVATLGTVLAPGHPVMANVSSFNGGTSSYRPTTTSLRPGATEIARWSDGRILVAEGSNPKRIDLTFYPPPSTCRADFWDINTNGDELLANAMAYVAGAGACYPDCDTSTGVGVLDIFDFLCFQNRYDAGSAYACDCDTTTGPGVCDIFDFLCFQNAYDGGCP